MMDQNQVQTHVGPYVFSLFFKLNTRTVYRTLSRNLQVFFGGEACLLILLGILIKNQGNIGWFASVLFFGGFFFVLLILFIPKAVKSVSQRTLNEEIDGNLRLKAGYTLTFSFSEDEFEVSAENSWERLKYAECYGYLEDPEFLFIQPQKNYGYPLEKKNCDPDQLQFLKQKLVNRIR